MTFPADAVTGGSTENAGGENTFTILFHQDGLRGLVHIGLTSGTEIGRRIDHLSSATDAIRGEGEDDQPEAALNSILTDLVDSVGRPPKVSAP